MSMKHHQLYYLLVSAVLSVGAYGEETEDFWDTEFGWDAYRMSDEHTAPLRATMQPYEQHARRYPGVSTHADVLERSRRDDFTMHSGNWELFPSSPQHFMPYLDSLFVPGNSCTEPSWLIRDDALSMGAQRIKAAMSRHGIQYNLTLSGGFARITPGSSYGRNDFLSTNNSFSGTWFLLKKKDNSQGLFISIEADWGRGYHFNERKQGVQHTIGSLSNPQSSLRGGNGVYIPHLALGYSLADGKWVGMIGTIDTSSYLDQNAYSASWNGNLMNSAFTSNPCLPLEWANWAYLTAWQPCDSFYAMYATTGCNGEVNQNPFHNISSNSWVHLTEVGWVCNDFMGLGKGTYRFQYAITRNDGETGAGAAINIQQQLGKGSQLGFFTRCGVMDHDAASVSEVRAAATAGVVLQAPFRDSGWGSVANSDQIALGAMWLRPADSFASQKHQDEYGLELSAVIQLTPTFFIQPDVQYIFNPAGQTDRSGEFVFQLQGVFKF